MYVVNVRGRRVRVLNWTQTNDLYENIVYVCVPSEAKQKKK